MIRALLTAAVLAVALPVAAQDESAIRAEFRREAEKLHETCAMFELKAIGGCALTLATANPLHVTFGSIAPGNGVAVGPALVGHHTHGESFRLTWSVDAVAAPTSGAWRAGGYLNVVPTPTRLPTVSFGDARETGSASLVYPVYSIFAQSTSLDRLSFFGLGPSPSEGAYAIWTMQQTVIGGSGLIPIGGDAFGFSVLGGITGRFIRVGSRADGGTPGIAALYATTDTPGVGDDQRFAQFTEGIRLAPTGLAHIRPTYQLTFNQFVGEEAARASFNRVTLDLVHEFPFYRVSRPGARNGNTPNDCSLSISEHSCPSPSRDRYGAISVRIYTVASNAHVGHAVPFYLQPTLGGSDIDGEKFLTSFRDYWFRAPNALALQATIEHKLFDIPLGRSITLPLGGFLMVEQGKVADQWGDLFEKFEHSYSAGLTVRAGGFPEVYLLYAWGREGRHFTASINTSLLGGSSRPSLD